MRITRTALVALATLTGLTIAAAVPAFATACTTVTTSKGVLSAAQVGGSVTGTLHAALCQIGVYYDAATGGGEVDEAAIDGAMWYGVFVDGGGGGGEVDVNVTDSSIQNIGEVPFNGSQHGVGVYYYGYRTPGTVHGVVSGNAISEYQKGGIVTNGENASTEVTDNTVTGLGPIGFIAQNGIQFGFGATVGALKGNTVSGNIYTQTNGTATAPEGVGSAVGVTSTGVLLYEAASAPKTGSIASSNHVFGNQSNITVVK